jgi:hypothetical protein
MAAGGPTRCPRLDRSAPTNKAPGSCRPNPQLAVYRDVTRPGLGLKGLSVDWLHEAAIVCLDLADAQTHLTKAGHNRAGTRTRSHRATDHLGHNSGSTAALGRRT